MATAVSKTFQGVSVMVLRSPRLPDFKDSECDIWMARNSRNCETPLQKHKYIVQILIRTDYSPTISWLILTAIACCGERVGNLVRAVDQAAYMKSYRREINRLGFS